MAGSKRTLTGSRKKVRDVPKAEESFTDDSNSEAEEDSEIDDSLANHKDTRNKKWRKGGNQIEDKIRILRVTTGGCILPNSRCTSYLIAPC